MVEHYGRTHYESLLETRFGVRYNELNAGLFCTVDRVLNAISLLAGSAAFGNLLTSIPLLTEFAGLAVALAAITHVLWAPARKETEHRHVVRQFGALVARAAQLDLTALDEQLQLLRAQAPAGVDALNAIAQADVLRSAGHSVATTPNGWERFVGGLT